MNYIDSFQPGSDGMYRKNVLYTPQQLIEKLTAVEQEVQANLDDALACLKKANILITMGRFEEAQLLYERTVWLDPQIIYPYLGLSILFRRRSLYQDAQMTCDRAIQLAPKSSLVQVERAMILLEQNSEIASHFTDASLSTRQKYEEEVKEGFSIVEFALQRDSKNAMVYVARSYGERLLAVKAIFGAGKHRQAAVAECNNAIQLDSLLGEAYFAKTIALLELKQYQDALSSINRFTELEPYDVVGYQIKHTILQYLGRKEEASRILLEAGIKLSIFESN